LAVPYTSREAVLAEKYVPALHPLCAIRSVSDHGDIVAWIYSDLRD
jgi:hypothetical protein